MLKELSAKRANIKLSNQNSNILCFWVAWVALGFEPCQWSHLWQRISVSTRLPNIIPNATKGISKAVYDVTKWPDYQNWRGNRTLDPAGVCLFSLRLHALLCLYLYLCAYSSALNKSRYVPVLTNICFQKQTSLVVSDKFLLKIFVYQDITFKA